MGPPPQKKKICFLPLSDRFWNTLHTFLCSSILPRFFLPQDYFFFTVSPYPECYPPYFQMIGALLSFRSNTSKSLMNVAESLEWMSEWNVASSERTSWHWKYTYLRDHLVTLSSTRFLVCLQDLSLSGTTHFSACWLVYATRTCNGWDLTCVIPHGSRAWDSALLE